MTAEVETNIVAVERIKEYGEAPQVCGSIHDRNLNILLLLKYVSFVMK